MNAKCGKAVWNFFLFANMLGEEMNYYASLNNSAEQTISLLFKANKMIDKVGSGDCFMAGLIHGIISNNSSQDIINFAAAAAFGKLQEIGDTTKKSLSEIEKLLSLYL